MNEGPDPKADVVSSYLSGADVEEYVQAVRTWQSAAAARNAAAAARMDTEERMVRTLYHRPHLHMLLSLSLSLSPNLSSNLRLRRCAS